MWQSTALSLMLHDYKRRYNVILYGFMCVLFLSTHTVCLHICFTETNLWNWFACKCRKCCLATMRRALELLVRNMHVQKQSRGMRCNRWFIIVSFGQVYDELVLFVSAMKNMQKWYWFIDEKCFQKKANGVLYTLAN